MNFSQFLDNPFQISLSFHSLIEQFKLIAGKQTGLRSEMAKLLLTRVEAHPELINGIQNAEQLEQHNGVIKELLADLFPSVLTRNEIKAVSIPYMDIILNPTERFEHILAEAGSQFTLNIRDFDDHQFYVMSCCLILNEVYGTDFDFRRPLFCDIPAASGIIKHYRILYNADFIDIIPTPDAVEITPKDIDLLRDNYDDLELWKQKFPPGSWLLKGFSIMSLVDVSIENAVSVLKETLLQAPRASDLQSSLEGVFRTIYRIPDIRIGFTSYNPEDKQLSHPPLHGAMKSFLLHKRTIATAKSFDVLCADSFVDVIEHKKYFVVSDLNKYAAEDPENGMAKHFLNQSVQSFILVPMMANGNLLGIMEVVSYRAGELNSINANKLNTIMPYLIDTIDRRMAEFQNKVQALIQSEYTTIHSSVYWKFKQQAIKAIQHRHEGETYKLQEITFTDVYPLYGQIDIKDSSATRNRSVQQDLKSQLRMLISIAEQLQTVNPALITQSVLLELQSLNSELSTSLKADTEQYFTLYLQSHIHPLLQQALGYANQDITPTINDYFTQINQQTGSFHQFRRNYEVTVSMINERMSTMLDKWQQEAQLTYPHFYERFKTDGVEHNLYIGQSIAPNHHFARGYLYNLRLWQLQVMCQMELEHHYYKASLPYPLEVTSLILSFSTPLSIRFRMDEKRFDVDGTYNARFEMVKKRVDKACIKGTNERITAVGKITVVYSNMAEEVEYESYIRFLQNKGMLAADIEKLEIEDLQGLTGLKALRVSIIFQLSLPAKLCYNYAELKETLSV